MTDSNRSTSRSGELYKRLAGEMALLEELTNACKADSGISDALIGYAFRSHVLSYRRILNEIEYFAPSEIAARDAKDAARYRWLRAHHQEDVLHRLTWYLPGWTSLDAAGLDEAIDSNLEDYAAESARNEYGGIGVARDGTDV